MPQTYEADSVDGSANPTGEAEMPENVTYEQNIDGSANPVSEAETSGPVTTKSDWVPKGKVVQPESETAKPETSHTAKTAKRK